MSLCFISILEKLHMYMVTVGCTKLLDHFDLPVANIIDMNKTTYEPNNDGRWGCLCRHLFRNEYDCRAHEQFSDDPDKSHEWHLRHTKEITSG